MHVASGLLLLIPCGIESWDTSPIETMSSDGRWVGRGFSRALPRLSNEICHIALEKAHGVLCSKDS